MAPDAPGNLVVIDLFFQDRELKGYAERVEYDPEYKERIEEAGGWLYVLWNETPRDKDYIPVGGGVVYVKKDLPLRYQILPRSPVRPDPLGGGRFAYRYPALGEGLMFVLIFPEGYTLADSRPMPKSAKVFKERRLAVYWKPEEKYGASAKVTWEVEPFAGDVSAERDRINADIDRSENVPDNPGAIVDSLDRDINEDIPSWFPKAGVVFGGFALLFLGLLVVLSLFGREIPTTSRFIVVAFLALTIGLSSTFLGGDAVTRGGVNLPFFKESPMSFAATGGIGAFVIVLVLGYVLYVR